MNLFELRGYGRLAAAILLASSPGPSYGDANSDQVARESARVAAEAAAREAYKSWADAKAATGTVGTGTATLAGIDIAMAAYDFANAKNDKQRFYSGLRAGAAGYVLASGPYAPIVAVAVAVASVAESAMAAKHAETLLEIYKRIEEHQKRIVEIQTMLAKADAAAFDTIVSGLRQSLASSAEAEKGLREECQKVPDIQSLADLDRCAFLVSSYYANARSFVDYANTLLAWKSETLQTEKIFEIVQIKPKDLIDARDAYASVLQGYEKLQQQFIQQYSDASFNLIASKVSDTPKFSTNEYVSFACIDVASQLIRDSNRLSLDAFSIQSSQTQLDKKALSLRAKSLLNGVRQYEGGVCPKFSQASKSKEAATVTPWLKLLNVSKRALSKLV